MVGAFGEVQVMDWGLAKRLRDAEGTAPTEGSDTHDTELTRPGAIGTPAYMAPEQARGEVHAIDPPSTNEMRVLHRIGAR